MSGDEKISSNSLDLSANKLKHVSINISKIYKR